MNKPDFRLDNHGSICILFTLTKAAEGWVRDHIPDDAMTWGANGTVIEPRYVDDILNGIDGDGLTVQS